MRRPAGLALVLGLLPALLAWGAFRLERDQPSWRHPALWGARVKRPPPPPLPRLVLAVHYPWYGTPDGPARRWRHWNHARLAMPSLSIVGFHDPRRVDASGEPEIGAAHRPLRGPYDSLDPELIRAQLEQARDAGLDGLVVSWWGRESPEAGAFLALLRAARGTGLRLAPYYETGELWRRGAPGVAADLESLWERHRDEPAWLRVDGDPVVFLYAAHRLRPPGWEYVLRRLDRARRRLFLIADTASLRALERPGWIERFDALHAYGLPVVALARGDDLLAANRRRSALARAAGREFVPAVAPGYDDRTIRFPGTLVERAEGATFDATWRAALAVDPPWILVVSWNEWHEGTEIEPSREHGRAYLDATRRWADRFRAGVRPSAGEAPAPARPAEGLRPSSAAGRPRAGA